ncbi:MAG TPA: two-component regulator propeller domain-containing protein, partial [Pseudoxanthomonas sp.]
MTAIGRAVALRAAILLLAMGQGGIALAGLPETPRPRQFSVADGLPSNSIHDITEDRQGYLWIATKDGLARYDGIGFRIWRNEQGLRDNFVWSVHADAQDRLWIGTGDAGLAMLDPARRVFRYYNHANTPAMGGDEVWTVTSTPDGAVWFGTSNAGLHRLGANGAVTRFMPRKGDPRSLPGAQVTRLAVAPDGTLWIATRTGAARWTGRDFERVPATALNSPVVDGLAIEPDGSVWMGTTLGVSQRTSTGKFSSAPFRAYGDETVFNVLRRDRSGDYWLDIVEGLGRIGEERIENVPLYSDAAKGIVKPSWSGAYEDRNGGLWFASSANGMWYLPANWRLFSVLSRRANDETSVANAHVRAIAPSQDGNMWLVGSGGVLDRLDPESGAVEHRVRNVGADTVPVGVLEDSTGHVWIGYPEGIARYDPADGSLQRWSQADASDPAMIGQSRLFAESGDGLLWIASGAGDVQIRDLAGRVQETILDGDGNGIAAGTEIDQLGLAPDGAVWLAGSKGLLMWNAGSRRFEAVPGGPSAPAARVYGFAIDGQGDVWIARLGLLERYAWDGVKLVLRSAMDVGDGIPLVAPSGLTVDASGIVWISSVRGLIRIDPEQRQVRVYGVHDGLPSQELVGPPVPRPADGRILVGSPDGLVIFNPAVVRPPHAVPDVLIETVSARRGDERIEFPGNQPFEIAYDDRDLKIVARLLSFNDANTNRYRFRLKGYEHDWIEVPASGERIFSQLEPGRYTLMVKARTADNVWSEVHALEFRVRSPWWWSWWAIAVWALLGMLAAWWVVRGLQQRLKRKHAWQLTKHKHELAEQASLAKTRFLATLGHEVRTPMTGVMGMSELLLATPLDEKQRGYAHAIQKAGSHLLRLVNDALDIARIEAGKLELQQQDFDLRALVEEAVALMAPVAGQRGLRFTDNIDAATPAAIQGDPLRVRQILLNLLGNAIKFTEKGGVSLRVSPSVPQGVRFEIADTGPGISEEQQTRLFQRFEQADGARTAARYGGSGLGLAICQELAMAMGGRIEVDSAPGMGTRFIVDLPLASATTLPQTPVKAASIDSAPDSQRPLRILLVEDDAMV